MTEQEGENSTEQARGSMGLLSVIGSVLSAGLGVQNSKNRERDFKQGNFKVFIISGMIFTLLFIGVVYIVVQVVLKSAGA
jgi:uncharacterized membrane protein YidH (DUF202 family)